MKKLDFCVWCSRSWLSDAKMSLLMKVVILCLVFKNAPGQSIENLLKKANKNPSDINNLNQIFDYQINLIDRDSDSAKIIFEQIQPHLKKLNNDHLNYRLNHELSRIGYLDAEYEKALKHAYIAFKLSKKMKNRVFEARASRLMMIMNHRLSQDTEAMKYAVMTANLLENSTDTLMLSSSYNSLSSFFSDLGQTEKSLKYSLKSIEFAKKSGDIKGLLGGMNNASIAYSRLNRFEEAEKILKEQIQIAIENNKPRSIERGYSNLCDVFIATDNLQKLNIYFPKFKNFVNNEGFDTMNDDNWSNFYEYEGKYHLYNLRLKEAEKSIDKGIAFAEKSSFKVNLQNLYITKSDIYTAWHKFNKATIYYEKYDSLEKSFNSLEMIKYGEELEVKYQLTQKQNQILQKDISLQKSRNNQWLLIGGFSFLATLAGLGFYSFNKRQKTLSLESELNTQKAERSRIASEMHDELGGNLTSMMYLAHQLKQELPENVKINKVMSTSSDISSNINEIIWSLNQEKNSLKDWVIYTKGRLIEMLESSDQNFEFDIPDNIPDRILSDIVKRNLYLGVKEIVNNAIKHAKAEKISVSMNFENGFLIVIADNGAGIEEHSIPKPGYGNGIINIKKRLAAIGASVFWKNENGTKVEIRLT